MQKYYKIFKNQNSMAVIVGNIHTLKLSQIIEGILLLLIKFFWNKFCLEKKSC